MDKTTVTIAGVECVAGENEINVNVKRECGFDMSWAGVCSKIDFAEHESVKCKICAGKAKKQCGYCYSIAVCGAPLCDKCKCDH